MDGVRTLSAKPIRGPDPLLRDDSADDGEFVRRLGRGIKFAVVFCALLFMA